MTYENLVVNIKVQVIHTKEVSCLKNLNLKSARKRKQLTQSQLAEMIKVVGKAAVSNWETGYSKPRLEVAILVSEILEEDIAFLFGYDVQVSCTKSAV